MWVMNQKRSEMFNLDNLMSLSLMSNCVISATFSTGEKLKAVPLGQYRNMTEGGRVLEQLRSAIAEEKRIYQMPDAHDKEIESVEARSYTSKVTSRTRSHGHS